MTQSSSTIGLFGTCGSSQWRDPFIDLYTKLGIPFFNPQVEDWKPELADIEAWHLVNDNIILFPVTDETYASASLAEIGFSIMSTLRWNANRFVVIYIAPKVDEAKLAHPDKDAIKNSNNARAIVKAHMKENPTANVMVVDNLEDMLRLSVLLHSACSMIEACNSENWKAKMDPDFWNRMISSHAELEHA
jgi:hypothetical protein